MVFRATVSVAACAILLGAGAQRGAAAESAWIPSIASGSWSSGANWANGQFPNAAGDIARFANPTAPSNAVAIPGQITLGQLIFDNTTRSILLQGTGPLVFDNLGTAPAEILYSSTSAVATNTISVPLQITDAEGLVATLTQSTAILDLTAGITSSGGNLTKRGAGTLRLSGNSAGWTGRIVVDEGTFRVEGAAAFGAAGGGALVNAQGNLLLYRNTDLDNEPIELAGGRLSAESSGGSAPSIANTLTVTADSRIAATGTFDVTGRITGAGGLEFSGSTTSLRGDNDYVGVTRIKTGRVDVYSATGLGGVAQGTILESGGQLFVRAMLNEPIAVRGGTLNFAVAAASTGPVTLQTGVVILPSSVTFAAPITLDHATADGSVNGNGGAFTGGISGTGDLKLRGTMTVNGSPLAHDGNLIIQNTDSQQIRLQSPNTFGGDLIVLSGNIHVDHAQSVGAPGGEFVVTDGALWLNEFVSRPASIDRGRLVLNRSDFQFSSEIRLTRGIVENHGKVLGPVILQGSTTTPRLEGGEFAGVVSGASDLDLAGRDGNDLTLSGQNTFNGVATVTLSGVVNANSSSALGTTDWATLVESGVLNVNAPTNERLYVSGNGRINLNAPVQHVPRMLAPTSTSSSVPRVVLNVPTQFDESAEIVRGTWEVNANAAVEGLAIRERGRVVVATGATLDAGDVEVDLQSGRIEGAVTGAPVIRKTTQGGAQLGAMPAFTGQVIVEQGILEIFAGSLGTPAGATHVSGSGQLMTRGSIVIADDIYLDDAHGRLNTGGLHLGPVCCSGSISVLNGKLNLGPHGSIIGAGGNGREGMIRTIGPVEGGSLTTWGTGVAVRLINFNNTYTGVTDVRQGYVELAGGGRLSTTSAIILHENEGPWDGTLMLDNLEGGANVDRVDASIPIELRGGTIQAFGGVSEAFGTLKFAEGHSLIDASMALSAQRIERTPGATAFLDLEVPLPVAETPANVGGVLPWMIVRVGNSTGPQYDRFGEVASGQIRALSPIIADVNAASATSNVGLGSSTAATLTADRTMKTLMMANGASLALGGHTLTVAAGGVIGGVISGGQLVPGADSGGELILLGGAQIGANIIDGPDGATSVTIGGGSNFGARLSGNNSFTGRLVANEREVYFGSDTALPEGVDLEIVGSDVQLQYSATATKQLGSVRLAGGGTLRGDGRFAFDEFALEHGTLQPGRLFGSGSMRKSTIGTVFISTVSSPTYNGQIFVDEGLLNVNGLPAASFVVNGGRLQLVEGANSVRLNGGELEFLYLTGPINVTAPSTLIAMPRGNERNQGLTGAISGAGLLKFDNNAQFFDSSGNATLQLSSANPAFTGDVEIFNADITVRHNQSLGSGQLTVHVGGQLRLVPNNSTTGMDLANRVNLDGGQLRGAGPTSRFVGQLHVLKPSLIGEMNVLGQTFLTHGASLTTINEAPTRFLGELHVDADSELIVGRYEVGDRGLVELGGTIIAAESTAALNVIRGGLDDLAFTASLRIETGRALKVLFDGELASLKFSAGQTVSGGGVLKNPVEFGPGGVISPGSSPGLLTLANTTITAGGAYAWEFNSLAGHAGEPVGWDLLRVDGSLNFAATPQNPWLFRIIGLPPAGLPAPVGPTASWLIAQADSITGFDPASVTIEKPAPGAGPQGRYFLSMSGERIFLNYQVPEPVGSLMLLGAIAPAAFARRRRPVIKPAKMIAY